MQSKATTLTALAADDGKIATKTHVWWDEKWETAGYTAGFMFRHWTRELKGLDDLGFALEKLSVQPGMFAIRGNVKAGAPETIQRTYKAEGSWIEDVDKMWLCIDIDGQPADPNRDHVEQAIALMPEWLQEADCIWRFSSSHGIKPANQLRLHLWYFLTRPVGNNALRHWARPLPIDGALYQPVQPHYTATPIFIGADDPVLRRLGYYRSTNREANPPIELLPSEAFVTWQENEAEQRAEERRQRHVAVMAVTPATRKTAWDDQKRYERIVREEVERIRHCPEGGRHDLIFHATKAVASLAGASHIAASARPELEAAACASLPPDRQDEAIRRVNEGWEAGLASPRALATMTSIDTIDEDFAALWPDEEMPNQPISFEDYIQWPKSGHA
jgi:hypothetical protein